MRWTQADVDAARERMLQPAVSCSGSGVVTSNLGQYLLSKRGKEVLDSAKPSKYSNVKTGSYASKREAKRAAELKLLEQSGLIANLREQVKFVLIPKQEGERACTYVADFTYTDNRLIGLFVVEDVKGYRNPVYRLKRKLMLHVHGIRVRET